MDCGLWLSMMLVRARSSLREERKCSDDVVFFLLSKVRLNTVRKTGDTAITIEFKFGIYKPHLLISAFRVSHEQAVQAFEDLFASYRSLQIIMNMLRKILQ
jgi:hypothetical protein